MLLGGLTDSAAGDSVASALERRPGDQQIRFVRGESLADVLDDLLLMLGEVVVAAIDRRHPFAVVSERLLERAAGTDGSVFESRAGVSLVLATDLGEELIQVMDDANCLTHDKPFTLK